MPDLDTIIRGGSVIDGSGSEAILCDVGIKGDTIAVIGDLTSITSKHEIDASNQVVCPGFINVLSWAVESLQKDGRGLSDLKQGVTLEVMGEGISWGPLNDRMKDELVSPIDGMKSNVQWSTLAEFLNYLVGKGISVNVASFVGSGTIRDYVMAHENRKATPDEIQQMRILVRQAMSEGALGIASALIYTPDAYFDTEDLIELAKVVAEYNGIYISHIRNESDGILEAFDELLTICKEAKLPCEIYHIKCASPGSWHLTDELIENIEQARSEGLSITANQYPYEAGATGLDAIMPRWALEGGTEEWFKRLTNLEIRKQIKDEIVGNTGDWENIYYEIGAENIQFTAFVNPNLRKYSGKTLAEVAKIRNANPLDVAMDLVVEDKSRIFCCYFSISSDNIHKKFKKPWLSVCSDAESECFDKAEQLNGTHPRAYGSFAKVLGEFVRERKLVSLPEAIRKMTSLPATTFQLQNRGQIKVGNYADIVIFDPKTIAATSTYLNPRSYATGVHHVWVNGKHTLKEGGHTGAFAGQVVHGPGYINKETVI